MNEQVNTDTNPDYTVVEVYLKIKNTKDSELIQKAIDIYLEDSSGYGLSDTFDQVNYAGFGVSEDSEKYLVIFLGPSHNFEKVENGVKSFLNAFVEEINMKSQKKLWLEDLESNIVPQVDSYDINCVRAYQW